MSAFRSILYLDDVRVPKLAGVFVVRNYGEFVAHIEGHGIPDLISFDHDLAREHYPVGNNKAGEKIPYGTYKEKTGFECARFIVENRLPLRHWTVHSWNVQGKINIEEELRRYCPQGEVPGFQIPLAVPQQENEAGELRKETAPIRARFSATSLLQFEDEIPLEPWERGLFRDFAKG